MKNKNNFFDNTFAVFQISDIKEIENLTPDYISNPYINIYHDGVKMVSSERFSSKYFYTEKGVYRLSDHWGECRSCFWLLEEFGNELKNTVENYNKWLYKPEDYRFSDEDFFSSFKLGFCKWENFYEIKEKNNSELKSDLYYIMLAFKDCFISKKVNDITPICQHPNHKSEVVRVVDYVI